MFISIYLILITLIILFLYFLFIFRRTLDAARWLNFKINVLEKIIYDQKLIIEKNKIDSAIDSVLAHDTEYKKTIKMLRKFINVMNKKSGQQKFFRHLIENRIEKTTDQMDVSMGLLDSSGIYHTVDVFKNINLEEVLKRFDDKFNK